MARPNWFIGLPVAPTALPADMLESLPAGIRRLHADDLHVTVAFLGAVDEPSALRAWSLADWSTVSVLQSRTGRRAAFGHRRRPSAYGLEIGDGNDPLTGFISRWRDPLRAAAGLPAEGREVRPHLTLGRPPRQRADTVRDRARRWLDVAEDPVALRLDRIALYTWARDRRQRQFARAREMQFGCVSTPSTAPAEPDR